MLRKYSNDVITVNYNANVFGFNLSLLTYKLECLVLLETSHK